MTLSLHEIVCICELRVTVVELIGSYVDQTRNMPNLMHQHSLCTQPVLWPGTVK